MPPKAKDAADCTFCQKRKKKGLGPCGHHGGPGNPRKKKVKPAPAPQADTWTQSAAIATTSSALERVRQLRADVERGKAAEFELDEIKKALK